VTDGPPRLRLVADLAESPEDLAERMREGWVRTVMSRALEIERRAARIPHTEGRCNCSSCWRGFDYVDVGEYGARLSNLAVHGLLLRRGGRNGAKRYRLVDIDDPVHVREARLDTLATALRIAEGLGPRWDLGDPPAMATDEDWQPPQIPEDFLSILVGLDDVKGAVTDALMARRPVPLLLAGPAATAKSLILSEVERLPGSRSALIGGNFSRAGLNEVLLPPGWPRILPIDELDKAATTDMGRSALDALLPILEDHRLTVTMAGRDVAAVRPVRCIATVNSLAVFRGRFNPLLTRFWVVELTEYTPEERLDVITAFLATREGINPDHAAFIAALVAPRDANIRAARHIAAMYGGDLRKAERYADQLPRWRPSIAGEAAAAGRRRRAGR